MKKMSVEDKLEGWRIEGEGELKLGGEGNNKMVIVEKLDEER